MRLPSNRIIAVIATRQCNGLRRHLLTGSSDRRQRRIAEDYAKMFAVLAGLPCDIFLGAHGSYFGMLAKRPQLKAGAANPFIDAPGYKAFVAEKEGAFRTELARQQQAAAH